MTALGQALSSGNLAAAQQAFQALQTDLQGSTTGAQQAHRHHHHHHQDQDAAGSAGSAAQAATDTGAQAGTSSTLLELLMASSQTA